jgi:ATP-dependent DNA helicase RecQ
LTQDEVREALDLSIGTEGVGKCEQLLERAGVLLRLEPCQNMAVVCINSELPTLVDLIPRQAKVQRRVLRAIEKLVGTRRFELVYFNRRDLLDLADVDAAALARALSQLNALEAFRYIPPFRGRAIHMLKRDVPFHELDIDFDQLERRKAHEYEKLEWMCRFAQTTCCRQQEILHYFGEAASPSCGRCDNCALPGGPACEIRALAGPSDPVLDTARRVLSGVARAKQRVGRQLIAQMLCGSTASNVTRLRLDRLSTYGLLSHLTQDEVIAVVDGLVAAGCLRLEEITVGRPVVQLTEEGERVMRGEDHLPAGLMLPPYIFDKIRRGSALSTQAGAAPTAVSTSANQMREAPPYASGQATNDRSTVAAGTAAPHDVATFEQDEADFETDEPIGRPLSEPDFDEQEPRPDHYWTWRLLYEGYSPRQCAVIRRLEPEDVLDHAVRAAEDGNTVLAQWFLDRKQIAAIERVLGDDPPRQIRPLLKRLPREIRYQHVELVLRCRQSARRV